MEVRPGYKQTEVGIIPEDWDAGVMAFAVETLEAGTSVNSDKEDTPDFHSYPCVLKTGAAAGGALHPRECKKVARRDRWRLKLALRRDTILISRMNTVELVGESAYVDADYPNLFVPDRLWMATIRSTVHPLWLSYVLTWQPVKSQISASATGTSGSMKNVSKPSLRAVEISYPPLGEQRAIAAALSDVDALLGGLDRLIAKKRDLKQASMQQLLTGQTRLPGFSGEWEVKAIGDLGAWRGGMTPSMQSPAYWDGGDFPWISSGDVKFSRLRDTSQHVTSWAARHGAAVVVPGNSLVLVTRSGILRKYLPVALLERPMAINQDIKALVPHETVSGDFLLHALTGFGDQILARCLKSGTTVESVEFPWLKAFAIPLPPRDEQAAIAAVLSDMDAALAALEARRDKIRDLKKAVMQELLTGKTRLVEPEASYA